MGLYVRDKAVNLLAEQLRKTIGARTKTEAVRVALERTLREETKKRPLRERLRQVQESTLALGKVDPAFDEKAFSDRMWGHE